MKLHRSFLSYDLDIFELLKSIRYIKHSNKNWDQYGYEPVFLYKSKFDLR